MSNTLLPFEAGTRQRRKAVGTFAANIGQTLPGILMPAIGVAAGVHLRVFGTMTFSGANTPGIYAPWSLINRLQFSVNLGSSLIYDTDGYGNFLVSKWLGQGWVPSLAGVGSTTPDTTNLFLFPSNGAAQPFVFHYYIPIALNPGADLGKGGSLNLQSPELQAYVNITMGQLTDIGNTLTSAAISIDVDYDYYEIGPVNTYALPPLVLSRILEQRTPIAATGDNLYVCPRLGVLLRYIDNMTTNGALTDCLSQARVVFNQTDYVYAQTPQWTKMRDRQLYLSNPFVGAYYQDLWEAVVPGVGFGSLRDAVNTEILAELDLFATVAANTTLGSNNNFRDVIRHVGQPLFAVEQMA